MIRVKVDAEKFTEPADGITFRDREPPQACHASRIGAAAKRILKSEAICAATRAFQAASASRCLGTDRGHHGPPAQVSGRDIRTG